MQRRTRKPAASRHLHRWRVLRRRSTFIQGPWIKLMFAARTASSKSFAPAHYQLMHFWSWLAHTHTRARTHTPTCGRWLAGPVLSLFVLIKPGTKLQASLYRSTEPSINKTSPAVIFNMTFFIIFFKEETLNDKIYDLISNLWAQSRMDVGNISKLRDNILRKRTHGNL